MKYVWVFFCAIYMRKRQNTEKIQKAARDSNNIPAIAKKILKDF
jgi:hypothetical protein